MFHHWVGFFSTLCLWRLAGQFGFEEKYVKTGDSVTLNSGLTEMKDNNEIQWLFGNIPIAEIHKQGDNITVHNAREKRFKKRLKLDKKTGSLTIRNITAEHTGCYRLQLGYKLQTNLSTVEFFLNVIDEEVSVMEGDSVTLDSGLTERKLYGVIQWRFGYNNTLIAELNKQTDSFTVYDDVLDGRFRDRLKLDNQTGSLTITDTRPEHAGHYKVQMMLLLTVSSKALSVSVYGV
ncbi:uncharacterized protein [Pseudorasbora parva]|uniref:uncharacterized protein isoform X2 n=1 Tax=Pseudorasbora parva TaxID=51549 RepID=UPI00351EF54B